MHFKSIVFLALTALCAVHCVEYHAVYVQHYPQDIAIHNDGNTLSIIATTLQKEVSVLSANYGYAHELLAVLLAGCTTHMKTTTNIKSVSTAIDTYIFVFNEEDALLLPLVQIAQPVEESKEATEEKMKEMEVIDESPEPEVYTGRFYGEGTPGPLP